MKSNGNTFHNGRKGLSLLVVHVFSYALSNYLDAYFCHKHYKQTFLICDECYVHVFCMSFCLQNSSRILGTDTFSHTKNLFLLTNRCANRERLGSTERLLLQSTVFRSKRKTTEYVNKVCVE